MPQVAVQRGLGLALATSLALLAAAPAAADETDACITAAESAQVDRKGDHLGAAHEKLLSCARDACPGAIQRDCKAWLAEVEARMPSIVVRAVDSKGNDVTAVRVIVDGREVTRVLDGKAIGIDPGDHAFRFEGADASVAQHIQIREGERDRLLSVRLASKSDEGAGIPVGAWVLGGVGLASLTVAAALWGRGRAERSDLYDTCGVAHSCSQSAIDHARYELVGGDVAAGIGLAALGAGIIWGAVGASATTPTLDAHPVVGGAVVTVRAAF